MLLTEVNVLGIIQPYDGFPYGNIGGVSPTWDETRTLLSKGKAMSNKENPPRNGLKEGRPAIDRDQDMERLRSAVQGIRYGEVRVVIQDGVIVQIERMERHRLR
jgi:hypothetical protein